MGKWILGGIMLVGLLLRVINQSNFPVGFTPDEASFGYDAYSIIKTGKDQWGHTLPLVLESFGDYKPPLYAYILTPFVATLGLEKWVVRLPNALLGTAAIYVVYLLVGELIRKKDLRFKIIDLRLVATLLLAISPWHIMLSRGAFEANLVTFFLPLGVLFFLKGLKKPNYLIYSSLVFGINLFSYHSAKIVTPVLLVAMVFVYRKRLFKINKNKIIFSTAIFSLFLAMTAYTFVLGAGSRASDINVFKGSLVAAAEVRISAINSGMNPFVARLIHNKYETGLNRFIDNYTNYLSGQFLFTRGSAEATYGMIPGRGVLYWFELPLFLGFLIYSIKNWKENSTKLLIGWILIAPIPAALSTGPGYAANRAATMLPALQIILAFGAIELHKLVKKAIRPIILFKFLLASYLVVSLIFFVAFLEDYFVLSPQKNAKAMLFGNLEAAYWVKNNVSRKSIVVTRKLSEPHIYFAFANKIDPKEYQMNTPSWNYKERGLGWVDQIPDYGLDRYSFKNVHEEEYANSSDVVLVGKPEEFSEQVNIIKTIYYPNGGPSVIIVDPVGNFYAETL